jgi:hypothetical protein
MWQYNFNGLYETPHIEHHGILGMKWGIRRYQYKDGTLTPEGKRKAKKARRDDDLLSTSKYSNKKYYKDATDEELIKATNRNNLEANYQRSVYNRKMAYEQLHPGRKKLGRKIVSAFGNAFLEKAAKDITSSVYDYGKSYVVKEANKVNNDLKEKKYNKNNTIKGQLSF